MKTMKYKLKKWYPSLRNNVCVGDVVEKRVGSCVYSVKDFMVNPEEVENNPEFWEQVKDYEILSFIYESVGIVNGRAISSKRENGLFVNNERDTNAEGVYSEDYILNNQSHFKIHSVRCLKNGKVFTVGDKAKTVTSRGNHIIDSFSIRQKCTSRNSDGTWNYDGIGRIWVRWDNDGGGNWLDKIEHYEEPLFITEDGKEVFNEDTVWGTNNKSFTTPSKTYSLTAAQTLKRNDNFKYFSTKEAAKEYIVFNKPCLSINDILSRYDYHWSEINQRILKELVKSKL